MRKLKNNVILSLIMVLVAMFLFAGSVNASSSFIFGNDTNDTTTNTATTNTATTNTALNTVKTNTVTTTTTTNTQIVNNINDNATKDLPKTGETDTYIIAAVGAVTIVIGGIAYVVSKKNNM